MSRAMKDSGIPWIGEIPDSWQLLPTKRVFSGQKRVVGKAVDDYERLALTMQGVIKRNKEDNEGLQPEKFDGYQILRQNELVFKLIDLQNEKTSRVGLSPYTGIVSPAYIIISNTQQDNRFYYYWFLDMYYRLIFNQMGDDGVRSSLNMADVLGVPLPSISQKEQKAIADFLDKKCGEIDEMVLLQEKIIEELKAYKQSVITEAVTKGLNPDVPMKDSGIDWIGQIPEEWDIRRGKNLAKVSSGFPFNSSLFSLDKQYIQLIRIRDILNNESSTHYSGDYPKEAIVRRSDILVGMDGDFNVAFWEGEEGLLNQRVCKLIVNQGVVPKYVYYVIQRPLKAKNDITYSTTVKHLATDDIGVLFVPFPPFEEQQVIADYLDTKCSEIDALISLKQSKIDALKEYKKSIIYEYITGKKEVEA